MRYDNVHVQGLGVRLGRLQSVEEALELGLYRPEVAAVTEQRSVSVSDAAGPDLAVEAGREALAAARAAASGGALNIGLHLHVSTYFQGLDLWSASSYVLNQLDGPGPRLSAQFSAMSNGCVAALEVAASIMNGRPDVETALITAGDRFGEPGLPHWGADTDMTFGDAGSAVVLGTAPGVARLVSTASYSDPTLESLHRGAEELHRASPAATVPIDLVARREDYFARNEALEFIRRNEFGMREAVKRALGDAELAMADMAKVLVPFFGRKLAHNTCLKPLEVSEERTLTQWGLTLGHLGGSDQFVGLHHLIATGAVVPGDHVLLFGAGSGFTWTAAVVRITGAALSRRARC